MSSRSSLIRIAAAWLLGLICAVAAAILTITILNAHVYGPQQQVRDYFHALHEGDGPGALGILHAKIPDGNPAMLDGAALKASVSGINDVEIGDAVDLPDSRITLPVQYTLDGKAARSEFELERTGTHWLFFHTWEFVPSTLPTTSLSIVNEDRATLNGTPVALPGGNGTFPVFYPGSFAASYKSTYFAADQVHTAVTNRQDANSRLALDTKPTGKLRAEVDAQIHDFLDKCAAQDRLGPPGCPFYHYTDDEIVGKVVWKITDYPDISIEAYGGRWVLKPLTGTAEVTSREMDLFTGAVHPLKAKHEYGFTAQLSVSENDVTVTPQVDY